MGKKDKAEKAKEDQRGKTARQDYQIVQSTLTWKIVQESAPVLKETCFYWNNYKGGWDLARVCSFKNFLLFFQAPKKGNPDDNATCEDFVKASGKEVTWVTEKDLEGMEETYKSLPKEEKKKMNFERPKKKDLEKSEVFALKSKNLLLWKFFKGENPGDSRSFLHERFNAYLGELNDCAKQMQEEGVSADAVMSQMPAKIPRPQLKGLTPINIEYWLDDNILPLVNFYSDKSSWVKKYVRFNFLPDDQYLALKRWTQGTLRRELLSVLEETWAMIQDELKEHVNAFKKLGLSPARNYHSIMSEGNTILELVALEHKFRVSSQDVLGEEADERFAEVRKLVDRTYANCDEVMPKTLLTPRAKEAGKK